MNRIKPQTIDFALTATVLLDYMQGAWEFLQSAYGLGGENYILSGCVVNGTSVGSGVIVINNEPIPFVGGVKNDSIIITETEITTVVGTGTYTRVLRSAGFGTGVGSILWGTLKRFERGTVQVGREVRMMLKGRSIGEESLRVEGCEYSSSGTGNSLLKVISAGSVYIPFNDTVFDVPAHSFIVYGEPALPHRWKITTNSDGSEYATLAQRLDTEPNTYADNLNRF